MNAGLLAQYVMNGLMLGMMYALVAVGFTLFFGVLDVIKFSHGDVLTVGAFTALAAFIGLTALGITNGPLVLLLILLAAVAMMALLGMLIARLLVLSLRTAPALNTLLITLIAIIVAGPLGLFSAIYLSEYATPRFRAFAKPILEILAGIPTVVLGFFAALTVAPYIRGWGESLGLDVASESALAAGLVMGMMIIPFISSLSDDVINAVPQSLRDGAYALGATKSETIKKVVLPAALPGIVSAFMLAISRAIGETMIVVMAAGLAANLTFNPLDAVTTITVQIKTILVGDQEFDSAKTLAAFALGFVLFFVTLVLNVIAQQIVRRYREQYD